jgi:hypothetical protein
VLIVVSAQATNHELSNINTGRSRRRNTGKMVNINPWMIHHPNVNPAE